MLCNAAAGRSGAEGDVPAAEALAVGVPTADFGDTAQPGISIAWAAGLNEAAITTATNPARVAGATLIAECARAGEEGSACNGHECLLSGQSG